MRMYNGEMDRGIGAGDYTNEYKVIWREWNGEREMKMRRDEPGEPTLLHLV